MANPDRPAALTGGPLKETQQSFGKAAIALAIIVALVLPAYLMGQHEKLLNWADKWSKT